MEIFNEVKSTFYKALEEIINTAYKNGKISQKEIQEILKKYNCNFPSLEKKVLATDNQESRNLYLLKKIDDSKEYALRINAPIDPYAIDIEILWLKFILGSRYVHLFLEDETIEKIKRIKAGGNFSLLPEILLPKNYSKVVKRESVVEIDKKLRVLIKAALEKRVINYTYIARSGQKFVERGIPVKIQYSLKDDLLYAIIYSINSHSFAKCVVQNLNDISIGSEQGNIQQILKEYEEFLKRSRAKEPIVLEVVNTRNALERAFCIFAPFEKSARFLRDKNKHQLTIHYYEFEEAEVLSRILYLGKDVVVISPERIRNEIISRVKKALEMYEKKA
ncbi:WYL domain-containing protein [Caldicellulosiruptor morganii]|uniref:WYL domain-containing protein n=1 Tax=Caldicellulosiruptor morganii TaxID=1387555 RepID=A0ABY7BQR4_9FIRM|nr:WYL domain-containing protein [Caldicellulosiruptor morganii]WAM33876.1 WYL domain-containing protein [Caldicellulosiruptor morganii]